MFDIVKASRQHARIMRLYVERELGITELRIHAFPFRLSWKAGLAFEGGYFPATMTYERFAELDADEALEWLRTDVFDCCPVRPPLGGDTRHR